MKKTMDINTNQVFMKRDPKNLYIIEAFRLSLTGLQLIVKRLLLKSDKIYHKSETMERWNPINFWEEFDYIGERVPNKEATKTSMSIKKEV